MQLSLGGGGYSPVRMVVNIHSSGTTVFRTVPFPFCSKWSNGWSYLETIDELEASMVEVIRQQPNLRKVLFIGMCRDSICALTLATRLHRTFPNIKFGVCGCAWATDYSGKSPSCKGVIIAKSHSDICNIEPYKTLLKSSDPLKLLDDPDSKALYLFGFYCQHPHWTLDEDATKRIASRLIRIYMHTADRHQTMEDVHTKILQIAKHQPELITIWLEDMFQLMDTREPTQ